MKKYVFLTFFISIFLLGNECRFIEDFKKIGKKYEVDFKLLCAIAKVESNFNPYAINNSKKSLDLGIMQINKWWFPLLKKAGMVDKRMLLNYHYNIDIGGWILRDCINTFGLNTRAIDCYNKGSKKSKYNSKYVQDILYQYNILTKEK